jgi:hypothetical protein
MSLFSRGDFVAIAEVKEKEPTKRKSKHAAESKDKEDDILSSKLFHVQSMGA